MQYLKIGLITKPHGINGEVKITPLTDNPDRFNKLHKIYLHNNNEYNLEIIESIKQTNNFIIVKFEKYNNRDDVEKLRNIYVYIDRNEGVPLDDGEYYTQDLVNCKLYFKNKLLGNIVDVINEGSCDIFIVKKDNNEIFYPFIAEYISKIDIINKKIDINYIEGYFD